MGKLTKLRYLIIVAVLAIFPSVCLALFWQQVKGDHFIVNFTDDKQFAQDVLARSEVYYDKIADSLGYPRYSDFWTWNKRVDIFIYPDHTSYLQATGQMEWTDGKADYKHKQISIYAGNPKFLETILPHEIAHLIFRDFIGFKGDVPLWLDEGVATSAQEETLADIKKRVKELYNRSALMTLDDLMTVDFKTSSKSSTFHRILMKDNSKGFLLLEPSNFIAVFYAQATSLVSFLKEQYGTDRFTDFCRELRDGKNVDEALKKAYPEECPGVKELEKKWREFLSKTP